MKSEKSTKYIFSWYKYIQVYMLAKMIFEIYITVQFQIKSDRVVTCKNKLYITVQFQIDVKNTLK